MEVPVKYEFMLVINSQPVNYCVIAAVIRLSIIFELNKS